MIKNVAILGATGSIGTHALEVIEKHPDRFSIWGLTSHTRTENCCAMIKKFEPKVVAVSSDFSFFGRAKLADKIEIFSPEYPLVSDVNESSFSPII